MTATVRAYNETNLFHATDHEANSGERLLSYSQISTWMACRHQWKLQYLYRLKGRDPKPQLTLGDAVHRYIASFLLGQRPEDALQKWIAELLATPGAGWTLDDELRFEAIGDKAEGIGKRALLEIAGLNFG